MSRRRVRRRRKQESNSQLANRPTHPRQRHIDPHAQRFQNIRRPAPRRSRPISMFSHPRLGSRSHNRRRRRNIERVKSIPASPARIHHPQRPRLALDKHRRRKSPHYRRKSRQFRHPNRPPIQRRKQPHNLARLCTPRKQLLHNAFRLSARENAPSFNMFDQRKSHLFPAPRPAPSASPPAPHVGAGLALPGRRILPTSRNETHPRNLSISNLYNTSVSHWPQRPAFLRFRAIF